MAEKFIKHTGPGWFRSDANADTDAIIPNSF